MTTQEAKELGRKAHAENRPAAPAADAQVMAAIAGAKVGDPNTKAIMSAFLKGYNEAIAAEVAAVLNG